MFFRLLKESAEKNLPAEPAKVSAVELARKRLPPIGADDSVLEAMRIADEIEDLATDICSEGQGFADSVLEKAEAIAESVQTAGHATDNQITALGNMLKGLQRWFHD
uniref:Uncharacterized protein n=1 Tax=viral metagenome TaxID=1070528 RepID=A0A6M3KWG7_9ZZZZ